VEEDEEKAVVLLMTTSYGLCSRPASLLMKYYVIIEM